MKAMREESALEREATYFLNWMNLLLACCKVDCRRCRFEGRSEGVEIELSGKYGQSCGNTRS
jgi:hypothetical protein